MNDTSGPTSPKQFAEYDPDSSSWKMWPGIGLWGLVTYSESWPRTGMTRSGRAFELPTSVPRTGESGSSSLLPTPADHSRGLPQPGTDYASLPNAVIGLLPTPTCGDAKSARNSTATRHRTPPTGVHAGDTLTDILVPLRGASTNPRHKET